MFVGYRHFIDKEIQQELDEHPLSVIMRCYNSCVCVQNAYLWLAYVGG